MLTREEIINTFVNTPLKENYNFLEEDLVTLANAFVQAAQKHDQEAKVPFLMRTK
jgi:hypothetical protein